MVFSILDWGRGQEDIDSRALGCAGTRLVGDVVHVGTSDRAVATECYPNIQSAEMRWWNFGTVMEATDVKS